MVRQKCSGIRRSYLGKAGERVLNASLDKVAPLAIEAITKYLGN